MASVIKVDNHSRKILIIDRFLSQLLRLKKRIYTLVKMNRNHEYCLDFHKT